MTRKEAIRIVEELLDLYANKTHPDIHRVMIYQRGFLTGVLADLVRSDFYAEQKIKQKIEKAKKK